MATGTMDTQGGFPSPDQQKVIDECKDDSFDFNLFIVSRPDDGITGGHMGFNQRYGFIFSDVSEDHGHTAAHELGHAQGLRHVDPGTGLLVTDEKNLMWSSVVSGEKPGSKLRKEQWDQLE
jgi:hypothetical protein